MDGIQDTNERILWVQCLEAVLSQEYDLENDAHHKMCDG